MDGLAMQQRIWNPGDKWLFKYFFGVTQHIPLLPFQVYGSCSTLRLFIKVLILPNVCMISMQNGFFYMFISLIICEMDDTKNKIQIMYELARYTQINHMGF